MYLKEFNEIYGTEIKKSKTDVVELIDKVENKDKNIINITNSKGNLISNGLNIVLKTFDLPKKYEKNTKKVVNFLKFKPKKDTIDEIIIDVLNFYSLTEIEKILDNILPSLKVAGEIYIEGTGLKNILKYFFTPNGTYEITTDTMKAGISALFDGKKSTLIPEIIATMLVKHNINNIMCKDKGILIAIKGHKVI